MRTILILITGLLITLTSAAEQLEYTWWFDRSTEGLPTGVMNNSQMTLQLDAAHLSPGIHNLSVMVKDKDGVPSAMASAPFVKLLNPQSQEAHVYIDGEFAQVLQHIGENGKFETELDMSNLPTGLHTIMTYIVSDGSVLSSIRENLFWRVPTSTELEDMKCFYLIDNQDGRVYDGSISGDILHADIDASSLADGLHSISFMLVNSLGQTSRFYTSYFLKMPVGGANIRSYSYWINDRNDRMINVQTENASNPFTLTALLPLEKQEFRSSSYHFDVEDGTPAVYTQNDFNIMLRDNRGFFTLHSFPYYETSSRREIKDEIEPMAFTRQKVKALEPNSISWFSFEAQKGDSLAFRLSANCAFEIYNPDGSCLMSSTPDKSRSSIGKHASQNGTYYIAIHEQLGGKYDFEAYLSKIDKFALLNMTPRKVSGGDIVIFNIEGNGFDKLKSVQLVNDKNEVTALSDNFNAADWSYCKAMFNFTETGLPEGNYNVLLTFADEDGEESTQSAGVEFGRGAPDDLKVSVNPHNTSIADVREIEVTIYNPSDYAYWGVPFCVARTSTEPVMAFDFLMLAAEESEEFPDPVFYDTDNLLGMGVTGRYIPMVIPYVGPKEKLVYKFSVERVVDNDFEFYAWCGEPWSLEEERLYSEENPTNAMARAVSSRNYYTLTRYQNMLNTIGLIPHRGSTGASLCSVYISVGKVFAGIQLGLGSMRNELYRSDPRFALIVDDLPDYRIPVGMTPMGIFNSSGLLRVNLPENCNPSAMTADECQQSAESGEPMPEGTPVRFPSSVDPNDLTGYISEAGSKYIGKAVEEIDYTVEFENDPDFAKASALSVKITNNLDINLFDPASFKPKELKIGKKSVAFSEKDYSTPLTIDMRPEINSIAEVKLDYDSSKGRINLHIRSLNPHTMDKSDDVSQGFLPVNYSGYGIGEFTYSIGLRNGIAHLAKIPNQAEIVFDSNDAIKTPVWENITDYISPVSSIVSISQVDDKTLEFEIEGSDEGSGIWNFDLYTRESDSENWRLIRKGITEFPYTYPIESVAADQQFLSVAVDLAGNREENAVNQKIRGDLDRNGQVDVNDLVMLYSYYVGRPISIDREVADLNNDGVIDSQDAVSIQKIYINQDIVKTSPKWVNKK